jgi:predicted nucleic acid-binding protein
MSARYFFDTNILIYQFDDRDPGKQTIAKDLIRRELRFRRAVISYQVVQESYNTMFRRFPSVLTPEDSERFLSQVLRRFTIVGSSHELFGQGCACTKGTSWAGTTA